MKFLSFAVRRELMVKAAEDLRVLSSPKEALAEGLSLGFGGPVDPEGQPLDQRIVGHLGSISLINRERQDVPATTLNHKTVAILFSASWCPGCQAFLPKLITTYRALERRGEHFEVVFVSGDRDEESFNSYFNKMPWLAVPFSNKQALQQLSQLFRVRAIPTLVILDLTRGRLVSMDGCEAIASGSYAIQEEEEEGEEKRKDVNQ